MIEFYNAQVFKWQGVANKSDTSVDDFVVYDSEKISWSSGLKQKLKSGYIAEFAPERVRQILYRPFTKSQLYFDRFMTERGVRVPINLPHP